MLFEPLTLSLVRQMEVDPMPSCMPFSPRGLRTSVLALSIVVAALGCREDPTGPVGQESGAVLATAATALAFYQVSAGASEHTCGITSDNRAYCWGRNSDGQLGDGTTAQRLTPVAVAGTLRFHQISAGYSSTCGVTTDHRAYCWGTNGRGELGDGTTTPRLTPVPGAGGHQFRQVATTFEHTCGVSYPDNKAYCWGWNSEGQIGDGTRSTLTGHLTPVAVAGTLAFRQVSAGNLHTCGVTTDNRAFCWGLNRYGQVGDSSTAWRRVRPTRVAGMRQFRQVDAGRYYTCAVTTGNRAFCWGYGLFGQLGNGKPGPSRWPKAVSGGLSFERVTTGAFHACGETTLNRAYCWGNNGTGQLGDGTTIDHPTPVAVIGGHSFSQVSAGGSHTCGRTAGAVAYCWGRGFSGQLGNGSATSSSTAIPVAGPT
jgi:alpha-tubulin suppressor-like RCC1 family protein